MRFRNEDGAVWIANFSGFFEFPDPRIGVIISRGTCYFLPFDHPDQMANGSGEITSAIQSESGNLILGSLTGEMVAFDRLGRLMWRRNDFAADDLIVRSCVSGTIVADVEDWHGNWCIIRVAEDSGADR